MLSSRIGTPFNVDTNEGVIGRNLCYQYINSVNMFWDKDVYINQFIGTGGGGQAIEEFNADNFDHGPLGFIGGGVIWGRQTGNGPVRGVPLPEGTPKWGTEWKQAVVDNFLHTGRIESQSSSLANRAYYADLDPTYKDAYGTPLLRLTFDWNDNDLRSAAFLGSKVMEIGRAMNPKSISGRVFKPGMHWDTRPYQSTHVCGGTPMGADPKTSAVNKYLQSWDVSNVFVLGANTFAHGIGYNPTGLVGGLGVLGGKQHPLAVPEEPRADGPRIRGHDAKDNHRPHCRYRGARRHLLGLYVEQARCQRSCGCRSASGRPGSWRIPSARG